MIPLFAIITALLLGACAHTPPAVDTRPAQPLRTAACPSGHPHMLWRVGNDSAHIWLLGSIHMADSSLYPLSPAIRQAFDQSEALAVELNISEDSIASDVGMRMAQQGRLPAGKTLQELAGPQLWQHLDSTLKSLGVASAAFQPLQPWFAALQLASLAVLSSGMDPELGIDLVLIHAAYASGKEVLSLETPAQQIEAFAGVADSIQLRYLETTLNEVATTPEMIDSLLYNWRCGADTALAERLLDKDLNKPEWQALKDNLYSRRNEVMAQGIADFLQEKRTVFVVVGTAHLLGDENVLTLLARQGYNVRRY